MPIELDDLYDDETVRRIDRRVAPTSPPPAVSRGRTTGASMAIMAGIALGLREVFDPPERAEIEEVDPWRGDAATSSRVRLRWHPSPRQTVAEVRW